MLPSDFTQDTNANNLADSGQNTDDLVSSGMPSSFSNSNLYPTLNSQDSLPSFDINNSQQGKNANFPLYPSLNSPQLMSSNNLDFSEDTDSDTDSDNSSQSTDDLVSSGMVSCSSSRNSCMGDFDQEMEVNDEEKSEEDLPVPKRARHIAGGCNGSVPPENSDEIKRLILEIECLKMVDNEQGNVTEDSDSWDDEDVVPFETRM